MRQRSGILCCLAALKEIRYYQLTTANVIPKLPFQRLVREILWQTRQARNVGRYNDERGQATKCNEEDEGTFGTRGILTTPLTARSAATGPILPRLPISNRCLSTNTVLAKVSDTPEHYVARSTLFDFFGSWNTTVMLSHPTRPWFVPKGVVTTWFYAKKNGARVINDRDWGAQALALPPLR